MIRTKIQEFIRKIVKSRWGIDLELNQIKIDYPPEKFGDYSTNVAMFLAEETKSNPMETAGEIAKCLGSFCHSESGARRISAAPRRSFANAQDDTKNYLFENIEVFKPGFINFYLKKSILQSEVAEIEKQDESYGDLGIGRGQKVQVEFISANPTGPLTLGNGRGGFYGDVLANVLAKAGYKTQRAYYLNNAGYQIKVLGHSILKDEQAQYTGEYIDELRNPEKLKEWFKSKEWPSNFDELKVLLGPINDLPVKKVGQTAALVIFIHWIKPTIEERMKINFDEWIEELGIRESGLPEKILEILKEKNLIYEKDGAVWFKSTEFGDDKDRVLMTSAKDGREREFTYLLPDAACHYKKFVLDKFDRVIDVWGADHHGYVNRLQAAGKALGAWDENKLKIVIMQLVRLMSSGKEVKMSKRAGTYVTLDELLDKIPLDVARFFFLMYSPDSHMNFDLDLAKEQNEKNPVYYVQYAHARICSIFNKYNPSTTLRTRAKNAKEYAKNANLDLLEHESELGLIKQLIRFHEIIEDVARDYQVHRLPNYALDLVGTFHKFYEDCRVIDEKAPELTQARLALVQAVQIVLKNTLGLMGISAPEKM